MFIITISELAKKVNISKSTLNRYVDIGLIEPTCVNPKNNYRHFNDDIIRKVEMMKTLKEKPFRLKLKEIKDVLNQISLSALEARLQQSEKNLLDFLIEKEVL